MIQPDLFGPCATTLALREAVRRNAPQPAKQCACATPCWWRKGGMNQPEVARP